MAGTRGDAVVTRPKMSVVTLRFHDRFGNNLFQYCFARAYAERIGATLQTSAWVGQQIFELSDPPIEKPLPQRYDMDFEHWDGESHIDLTGWGLHQKCLIYTREQAREWLVFKPWIRQAVEQTPSLPLVAHLRHGDFVAMADYVAVSNKSYTAAWASFELPAEALTFVSEDDPTSEEQLVRAGLGFLPDFFLLMRARILMRANSTFSWWAHVLGNNERIFSPCLTGIEPRAGVLQDAPFVEGNWPAISCRHLNCSDLHLR